MKLTFGTVFGVVTIALVLGLLVDRLMIRHLAPEFHGLLVMDMTFDLPIAKNIPFPKFSPLFVFGTAWLLQFIVLCVYLPIVRKQPFRDGLNAWLQVPYYASILIVAVGVGETIYIILEGLFDDVGVGKALKNIGENFRIRASLTSTQFSETIDIPLRLSAIIGLVFGYYFLVNKGVREALVKLAPGFFTKE